MSILNIPDSIRKIIENKSFKIDNIGMSDSEIICFDDMVLKIGTEHNEILMMEWLQDKLPVPKVLAYEENDDSNYLLMSKINGQMLCNDKYMNNSKMLVKLLAEALNMFWSIDISDCPCSSVLDKKLEVAEYRVQNNLCDVQDAEPTTFGKGGFLNPTELLNWLKKNKPNEELTLSHGDFCLPNIFANENKINGFIDLGRSGVADKYQDISLCYRSLKHNFSGKFSGRAIKGFDANSLFEELGIRPNKELINYYILLGELF